MKRILEYLKTVTDERQEKKVRHNIGDIIALVFFATLADADEWTEIELFGNIHEKFLRKYLELPYGIPSHDTIQRVFAMVVPDELQQLRTLWDELISSDEGDKVRKILSIDGKTQRGNGNKNQKANHIVSAVDQDGYCLGEKRVSEKTNEIAAIPELLNVVNVKGHIVTLDAMGTQTKIAQLIRQKRADYVLALKENQGTLFDDVKLYFSDAKLLSGCAKKRTVEKARGGIEIREYWQTTDIAWLTQKKDWAGLSSIAMTQNTIKRDGKETTETRYFISSLPLNIDEAARAIRGHWMVESMHWHLDVTFREDANQTAEKYAAFNLNIMRKLALNVLKSFDIGKKMSLKLKRFAISLKPEKFLEQIINI